MLKRVTMDIGEAPLGLMSACGRLYNGPSSKWGGHRGLI